MFVNGKMRPAETVSGIKENDRGDEFNCDTFHTF
jgi:hypothetical protein